VQVFPVGPHGYPVHVPVVVADAHVVHAVSVHVMDHGAPVEQRRAPLLLATSTARRSPCPSSSYRSIVVLVLGRRSALVAAVAMIAILIIVIVAVLGVLYIKR
jgi:hypothetical protein